MLGLSSLTGLMGGAGMGGGGSSEQFNPSLGPVTPTVTTGSSQGGNTLSFGKSTDNDLLKYGIAAGVLVLALVIFKRKR